MNLVLATLFTAGSPETAHLAFEGCLRAHRAMKSGAANLEVRQILEGKTTGTTYQIQYIRPNQVLLKVVEPAQGGRAASNRTFALIGDRFFGYDALVHEQLSRKTIPVGTMLQKLTTQIGSIDDSAAGLIEPDRLAAFIRPFRESSGWTVRRSGAQTIVAKTSSTKPPNRTEWRFETTTWRLRGLRVDIPQGRLEWSVTYGDRPKAIGWRPPKDAPIVASFTVRPGPPKYGNAEAKTIAEKSMRAYDRLQHLNYWTESSDGIMKVWLSADKLRQESRSMAFSFGGGQGAIRDDRTKKFYSGRVGTARMVDALAKLGTRIDPFVRQIMNRQNPVRMLLLPGITVRKIGNIKLNDVECDLLEFRTPSSVVALGVRRTDGLLASLTSSILDPDGRVVGGTDRTFRYGTIGKPLDPAAFKLAAPVGYQKLAISTLAK